MNGSCLGQTRQKLLVVASLQCMERLGETDFLGLIIGDRRTLVTRIYFIVFLLVLPFYRYVKDIFYIDMY